MSSDGWIRSCPNPIHRAEPPALIPIPGTSTAISSRSVHEQQDTIRSRRHRS